MMMIMNCDHNFDKEHDNDHDDNFYVYDDDQFYCDDHIENDDDPENLSPQLMLQIAPPCGITDYAQ